MSISPLSSTFFDRLLYSVVEKNVEKIQEATIFIFLEDHNNEDHLKKNVNNLLHLFDPTQDVILAEYPKNFAPEWCNKNLFEKIDLYPPFMQKTKVFGWDVDTLEDKIDESLKKKWEIESACKQIISSKSILNEEEQNCKDLIAFVNHYCIEINESEIPFLNQQSCDLKTTLNFKKKLVGACKTALEKHEVSFIYETFPERQMSLINSIEQYSQTYKKVFVFAGIFHGDEKYSPFTKEVHKLVRSLSNKKFCIINPDRKDL